MQKTLDACLAARRPAPSCGQVRTSRVSAILGGWWSWGGSAGGAGRLIQRAAAAACGLNGEADEIFMPPRKAQVHAAVPANAEQLVTARATPFWVRGVGLGFRAGGPARGCGLARGEGSRHGSAPLCGALPIISRLLDRPPAYVRPLLDGLFLGWLGHGFGRLRSE